MLRHHASPGGPNGGDSQTPVRWIARIAYDRSNASLRSSGRSVHDVPLSEVKNGARISRVSGNIDLRVRRARIV